jgi:hypothetical protein
METTLLRRAPKLLPLRGEAWARLQFTIGMVDPPNVADFFAPLVDRTYTSFAPPRSAPMHEFVAVFETAFKFCEEHWKWIALAVVLFAGTGFGIRMLAHALRGGKS